MLTHMRTYIYAGGMGRDHRASLTGNFCLRWVMKFRTNMAKATRVLGFRRRKLGGRRD
jgi:hypothetical protein